MAQYLKQDSELGYVEDSAEIEYLKFNNLRHTVLGCMLGDFDETGAYVVSPEIVEELIGMKKYIVENYDNIEICRSELKLDKQITFIVTFEGNKATLSLLEKLSYEANFKINSGTYSNINEYVLDTVETSGEVNRNMVYQRWNIGVYGGNVVDIFNCDESVLAKYLGVVNRFKYLLEANKKFLEKEEKIEEIEASYSNGILEILKSYPKLQKAVMAHIKETLNEKKNTLNINKPNFAKTFNEILDNAINSNIDVLNEKEKEEFVKDKRNVVVNTNIKKTEVVEVEHKKEDEQTPAVIKLQVPATYESKTIEELGEDFGKEYQKVIKKISPPEKELVEVEPAEVEPTEVLPPAKGVVKKKDVESEKNKLIGALIGAGIGAAIGGTAGMVAGAVAGAVVAEVVEEVQEAVKQTPKAPAKQTNSSQNGNQGKKTPAKQQGQGGVKPQVKKQQNTSKVQPSTNNKNNNVVVVYDTEPDVTTDGKSREETIEEKVARLVPLMTGQTRETDEGGEHPAPRKPKQKDNTNVNGEEGIVANTLTPEQMMLMDAQIVNGQTPQNTKPRTAGRRTVLNTDLTEANNATSDVLTDLF